MGNINIKQSIMGVILVVVLALVVVAVLPSVSSGISGYSSVYTNDTGTIAILGLITFAIAIGLLIKVFDVI